MGLLRQTGPVKWLIRGGAAAGWLAVSAVLVVGTANLEPDHGERPIDALGFTVVAVACLALAAVWRRRLGRKRLRSCSTWASAIRTVPSS